VHASEPGDPLLTEAFQHIPGRESAEDERSSHADHRRELAETVVELNGRTLSTRRKMCSPGRGRQSERGDQLRWGQHDAFRPAVEPDV